MRILVADDHTIVRQGLVQLLTETEGWEVIAEAGDGVEAVEKAIERKPDIAIVDLSMPRLSGIETVRRIHECLPDTRILVFSVHEEVEYIVPIVRAGASGYLVKDSAITELQSAVSALIAGKTYFGAQAKRILEDNHERLEHLEQDPYGSLTPREREVFHLVVEGHTTKETARRLGTSLKTAQNHRARLMEKLRVHNSADLVRYAAKRGLLP